MELLVKQVGDPLGYLLKTSELFEAATESLKWLVLPSEVMAIALLVVSLVKTLFISRRVVES